jgi:O-antigen ligase
MATSVERTKASKSSPLFRLRVGVPVSLLPVALLVVLHFCQAWWEVVGFTIRSEDVLILLIWGGIALRTLAVGKLRYYRHVLNLPLLLWCGVLLFGVGITLISPFDSVTKKDALVNGFRLVLAVSTFYVMYNHPASARSKMRVVISVVLGFSVITTLVSLLQIGYWDGWLPFSLPPLLTEKAPGANMQPGREIFGLFVGDTSGHTWSGMLALQALLVFLYARYSRNPVRRWAGWGYFGLLVLILLRTAVRNSLLGLFVAIVGLSILRSCHPVQLLLKLFLLGVLAIGLMVAAAYLQPDSYFVRRALAAVPQFVDEKLVIDRASSVYGRLDYYALALRLFSQRPLTGYGFYSYQALSGRYLSRPTVHAHNSYLQTLAELGIPGVVALVWLMLNVGLYFQHTKQFFRRERPVRLWWEFVTGSFILLAFTMLFSNTLWSPNSVALRMIVLGVFASLMREKRRQ